MAIEYKAVKMNSPLKKQGRKQQYYPRVSNRQNKNLKDIANRIAGSSAFSTGDIVGILEAFTTQIPYLLMDNCSVTLGELGTFSLHASGEGVNTPEAINASKIKEVRMAFRPGARVKNELKGARFRKIKKA